MTFLLALLLAVSPVRITISPNTCVSPCTVKLTLKIEPDQRNSMLRVLVDGDNYYNYGEIALTPDSHTQYLRVYKRLPPGEYAIAADLVRHDARDWVAGRAEVRLTVAE